MVKVMKKQFLNDIKLIFVPNDLTIKRLEKIDETKKPKILLRTIRVKQPKIKKSKFLLFNFFENFSLFKEDNSLKKYITEKITNKITIIKGKFFAPTASTNPDVGISVACQIARPHKIIKKIEK